MTKITIEGLKGIPGLVKMLPWLVAMFSGSAGGAITASALHTTPLDINRLVETEAKVLTAIKSHQQEFERIYGMLGALDDRQRIMHTQITRIEVQLRAHKEESNASH